jgi:hypothetical protein
VITDVTFCGTAVRVTGFVMVTVEVGLSLQPLRIIRMKQNSKVVCKSFDNIFSNRSVGKNDLPRTERKWASGKF